MLDRTVSASKSVSTFRNNFFYVGGDVRDSNDWFNGKISGLKIYTTALSDDRVMGEYLNSQLETSFLTTTTTSPSILSPNNGWTSSTGAFQAFSGNSGSNPHLGENNLIFSYTDNSYVYKDFDITSGTTTVKVEVDYIKRFTADTGQVNLKFYNGNNELSSHTGSVLTGATASQTFITELSIPSNANKVRVELKQLNEAEYWAGNYGFRFMNFKIFGVENGTAVNSSSPATASGSIDQENSSSNAGAGGTTQWQSFTISNTGQLSAVSWKMANPVIDGNAQPVQLSVYRGEGTGGALVAQSQNLTTPPYLSLIHI